MRKTRKSLVFLLAVSILAMPAALPVGAAATTEIDPSYVAGRVYAFQNVYSGKFLEVADGNLVSGANVWQDTFNMDTNRSQFFWVYHASMMDMEDGDGGYDYFMFSPTMNTDIYLDVESAGDVDGTNIKVFGYNPGYGAQSFRFIDNNDGSFRIQPYSSRNSSRVLSVASPTGSNKSNVMLSSWTGSNSQKWVIKEIEPDQDEELIGLNWSYFFRGDYSVPNRRISQRVMMTALDPDDRHAGIDLPADAQTPIYSPCAGKVVERGVVGDDIAESMGNYVIIRTTNAITVGGVERKLTIRLMHMYAPPEVSLGDTVTKNTLLGSVGDTGNSDGNHLHVDININNYHGGNAIRTNPKYVINPEKLYMSKRFKFGMVEATATYATDDIFYPDWSLV